MSSKAPRFTRAVSGDNNRKPVSRQSVEESIQQPRPAVVTSSNDRDREHNENGGIQAKHGPAADMDKTFGTGCLVCGKHENEHQILLCEICDGEYHMYCLNPPLTQIPSEEWLCDNCVPEESDDGLEVQVAALPPHITHRYGEVVWANGGVGYGWWPSILYDPRKAMGRARMEARKNLHKHLAFFFRCPEAPFVVLPDRQLKHWDVGLSSDLHMGKPARAHSKQRYQCFQEALNVAIQAMDLSRRERLETNWELGPGISSVTPSKSPSKPTFPPTSPETVSDQEEEGSKRKPGQPEGGKNSSTVENSPDTATSTPSKRKRGRPPKIKSDDKHKSDDDSDNNNKNSTESFPNKRKRGRPRKEEYTIGTVPVAMQDRPRVPGYAAAALEIRCDDIPNAASQKEGRGNKMESIESIELVCRIVLHSAASLSPSSTGNEEEKGKHRDTVLGFVVLPCKASATFADARRAIGEDLGSEAKFPSHWKFHVPNLGPVSRKQEYSFVLYRILQNSADAPDTVGKGTFQDPVLLFIRED